MFDCTAALGLLPISPLVGLDGRLATFPLKEDIGTFACQDVAKSAEESTAATSTLGSIFRPHVLEVLSLSHCDSGLERFLNGTEKKREQ